MKSALLVIISCSPSIVGDISIISSAYPSIPKKSPSIQQPDLFLRSTLNRSSMYTQNKIAESTAPCFTPLVIGNFSDMSLFYRTLANWLEYITNRRRTYEGGIPLSNSLLNKTLCWTVSKAFFISMTQTKTSEPFLIK